MPSRLRDNINSQYVNAANALRGRKARRRIVAYVESYDDVYFWRMVLSRFETERRYFEVMLPSHKNLSRGKKSVLMNFTPDSMGPDMIACVDADYDYMLQGATPQSERGLGSPYVFHTYVYAIENYQCYAPSLHDVCVAVTLNDHRIFDFRTYFALYSEICFPLFVWSIWAYRTGNHSHFSLSDFNHVTDPGGFSIYKPEVSLENLRRKVGQKVRELQQLFPNAKTAYREVRASLRSLGVTPQTTYLYMQGHHLFDTVVSPIVTKVCEQLRSDRQQEISQSRAHDTQKLNEMACYDNAQQDVKVMLKKNVGFQQSRPFLRILADIQRYLKNKRS